jgi:hypothetical protein
MTRASVKNNIKAASSKRVFCKSTIVKGINKGFFCAKLDCKKKNHRNIATHLELPKFIVDIVEDNKTDFDNQKLISFFDYCSSNCESLQNEKLMEHIMYITELFGKQTIFIKYVYFIYMLQLFDTPKMYKFINSFPTLRNSILNRIVNFQKQHTQNLKYIKFVVYLNEKFTVDGKFFCRENNLIDSANS